MLKTNEEKLNALNWVLGTMAVVISVRLAYVRPALLVAIACGTVFGFLLNQLLTRRSDDRASGGGHRPAGGAG
jgi:hypothetical protein